MKTLLIDGARYNTAKEIHVLFAKTFDWPYYGHNADALWDFMTTEEERPLTIKWINIAASREKTGDDYRSILKILQQVVIWDQQHFKESERLVLIIE